MGRTRFLSSCCSVWQGGVEREEGGASDKPGHIGNTSQNPVAQAVRCTAYHVAEGGWLPLELCRRQPCQRAFLSCVLEDEELVQNCNNDDDDNNTTFTECFLRARHMLGGQRGLLTLAGDFPDASVQTARLVGRWHRATWPRGDLLSELRKQCQVAAFVPSLAFISL